ncbi:sulfur carrier protein ThiS [Sphaerobacter thermophilus]|uniref:Thiamine biosynthesis protein ThiS n=1 Tax=Sphaerobacter thermophilus (strain ATCC 49802 / DSM 20745 / KCCM 41009 / NCIMB 13125 / S 6022) TaxID=479434 RepID=D1C3W0_SPHTD|nr:sulfur carrier protein ThiS [Sphaerobacter thermophilus]ACZ38927.1 thiamine biosynthesis protein ThiS [Sphaerobacter thermophilus DSM 20745]
MMEIRVNGKPMQVDGVRTVADLLKRQGIKPILVAVEHNGSIVPRAEFETRTIEPGDTLEIVHFVGGG